MGPASGGAATTGSGIINPTSGNTYWTESIYSGNGPAALDVVLAYNSLSKIYQSTPGSAGMGWNHNYSNSIAYFRTDPSTLPVIELATLIRANGKRYIFKPNAGTWIGEADFPGTLNQTTSGWTWTTRDGAVETYGTNGKLLTITDPQGRTKTLNYDANDRLASVVNTFGQSLAFGYNVSNLLTTITDPAGRVTTFSYDTNINLVRVQFPDATAKIYHYENTTYPQYLTGDSYDSGSGSVTRDHTLTYDSSGRAASMQRVGGLERFTVNYALYPSQITATDAAGNQQILNLSANLGALNTTTQKIVADNKTYNQIFDTRNNRSCTQNEAGQVTTYSYNTSNQKISETQGQGGTCAAPTPTSATRTITYQYLSPTLDLPTLIQSPSVASGSVTRQVSIAYNANRNPTVITQSGFTPSGTAVSRTVNLTYNASGQVISIDGPRADVADVTSLTYYDCNTGGGCGQLQSVSNALGQTTTYDSYDANGRVLSVTDPNGLKTAYTYDLRGRVTSITQTSSAGASRVTQYGHDAKGNVVSAILPTGLALTYTYNTANYLTQVVDSLGNRVDYGYDLKGNRTQTYTYDASGTLVRAVDLAFDARNRVSQINTGGSITKQVWDAIGNLTSVTDPNTVAANGAAATVNSYDSLNRLFKTVDLLNGNSQYTYDPNDRLKSVSAPNGTTTQYIYDDLGNLLSEVSPDRGTVTYTYDAAGNVKTQTDARGITVTYSYDVLNRLTSAVYPDPAENLTYAYDASTGCIYGVGRLCTVQDAAGSNAYAYDGFGNLVTDRRTELNIVYTTSYAYDAGNRVTAITYPNGRQVSYTRDAKGSIQTTSMTLAGTTTTLVSTANYRPDGLPTSRAFGNGLADIRAYDTQGRLRELYLGSADTRLYGYDANGNLTSLQSLPEVNSWSYDFLNRLKQEVRNPGATITTLWTYDANGNRKTQNTGTYSYLASSNRLTNTPNGSISLDAAGNTLADGLGRSFSYNQAGQLSAVPSNGASYAYNHQRQRARKIVGSEATVYHYDLAGNLLAETRTDGTLIRDYVYLDSMPIAKIEAGEILAYLHTDHLNTPRLATNAQAQVIWRWEGTAFGDTFPNEDVDGDGKVTTINLRFPGQYFDGESGLHYNWNRYYDPKTGRYITSDPVGLIGGLNTFVYATNNPLHWVDVTGLLSYNRPPPDTVPVGPDLEAKVVCLENCLGITLVITGGAEQSGHSQGSQHYNGQAVDFGFNSNPGIQSLADKFFCCAAKCGFKFGQTEYGRGPHYHLQAVPGNRGGHGEIPTDSCKCK
jgi:RHS repeat-associated protein